MAAGVAEQSGCQTARQAAALCRADRGGGRLADVADASFLDAVLQPEARVLERVTGQRAPPQRRERIEEADAGTGTTAGELIEEQLPIEETHPGGQFGVEEIRLGEVEREVTAQ